jgi:hypothetical protein
MWADLARPTSAPLTEEIQVVMAEGLRLRHWVGEIVPRCLVDVSDDGTLHVEAA